MCPGSRGAVLGAGVGAALEGPGALLIALPTIELAGGAVPPGAEVPPGTAGAEDWPPTMGVDEVRLEEGVVLEEVRTVLLGRLPAAFVVLPASGRGGVQTGRDGANGGRLGLGGLGALGGPAHAGVDNGFAATVTVTVTVSTTVTCWRFSSGPCGKARPPTARADARRMKWRIVMLR